MPAMSVNARTTRFVGLVACLGLVVLLLGVMPVASQAPPQRVTSDTPEYCLRLQDRVSEMVRVASAPPPHEVTSLSTEGQRMCDQGQTRGGILRLRRALLMMMHQGEQP
jgi:hypothetical protein